MLFTRRLMLGLAMAGSMAGALAFPATAEGPTEIDLFFPVPVDGKLARDMGTLINDGGLPGTGSNRVLRARSRRGIEVSRPHV